MDVIIDIFNKYGVWGLILVVVVYIIINGRFTFEYPRKKDKQEENK